MFNTEKFISVNFDVPYADSATNENPGLLNT
jgi:hypothetical protein